jgi:hypothetical protein
MREVWLQDHEGEVVLICSGKLIGFFPDTQTLMRATESVFQDGAYYFTVQKQHIEDEQLLSRKLWTDWNCICEPYLDTDMPDSVWQATRLLQLRGYSSLKIRLLRLFAMCGLWLQIFMMEWVELGLRDVLAGWAFNSLFVGILLALIMFAIGYTAAALLVADLGILGFLILYMLIRKVGK